MSPVSTTHGSQRAGRLGGHRVRARVVHGLLRRPVGDIQRLGSRYRDVGLHPPAFPVAAGDGVDRAGYRDGQLQVRVKAHADTRVRPAPGAFPDDGSPAQVLQVVRELLAPREGLRAGQHVDRLAAAEARPGHVGRAPGLPHALAVAVVHRDEMRRLVEQVAADQRHHVGVAAERATQVDDQRVGVGEQSHRRGHLGAAALTHLVDSTEDAGEGEPRYGVLVSVYRCSGRAADSP